MLNDRAGRGLRTGDEHMDSSSTRESLSGSSGEDGVAPRVVCRSWSDARRHPKWVSPNTGWGSYRATYPWLETEHLTSGHLLVPGGQRSPWHGKRRQFEDLENLVICVAGEIEFSVAS